MGALATLWEVGGKVVKAAERSALARVIGVHHVAESTDASRSNGSVDPGEVAKDVVTDRLGPAAGHDDLQLGLALFSPARHIERLDQSVVGAFADRAGVEDQHVGLLAVGGLPHAGRLEHALDALRVVHVHLATKRGDVKALHGLCPSGRARSCATRGSRSP